MNQVRDAGIFELMTSKYDLMPGCAGNKGNHIFDIKSAKGRGVRHFGNKFDADKAVSACTGSCLVDRVGVYNYIITEFVRHWQW